MDSTIGNVEPGRHGPGPEHPTPRRSWVLAAASVASFMVALDLLVITTALDTIRHDLGASASALQWTVTAYGVSFAALLMTGAALGDRFGRRRMLVVGLVGFAIGSAAAALSSSVGALIAARVVQGASGAVILPLSLTVVTTAFPPERRAAAIGALEGVTGLAVIAGPVVGGVVAEHLTWEWVFWINVPIALASVPLVRSVVRESHGPDRAIDGPGLALVSAAAAGIVWGLSRGNDIGWTSPEIALTLVGGVALAAGFVAWERRAPRPMLPLRFFRVPSFTIGAGAAFLLAASLYAAVFFMAQFMQVSLGEGSLAAGLRLLPWTGTLFVTAPLAGALADRVGHRPVLSVGLLLQAVGSAWLALVADAGVGYAALVPALVVAGVGTSAGLPVSQAAIVGSVGEADTGKAAGTNNMLQELGGAFGIAVAVAVFTAVGGYGSSTEFADGFGGAMAVSAGLAACGFLVSLRLPRNAAPTMEAAPDDADQAAVPREPMTLAVSESQTS
jgi:EmrB/QacA subfamily drug resistance transporter